MQSQVMNIMQIAMLAELLVLLRKALTLRGMSLNMTIINQVSEKACQKKYGCMEMACLSLLTELDMNTMHSFR